MEQEYVQVDEKILASIIDDLPDSLLDSQRNINIANFIVHDACQKYYQIYKSRWVPISFIEFNFEEFKRYEFMSTSFLKPFFDVFEVEDIPAIVENYCNCNYSLIKKKSNKNDELCYYIETRFYIDAKLSDPNLLGGFDRDLYKNLDNISAHMDKSDEVLTLREIYEYFMMKKVVLRKTRKNNNQNITQAVYGNGNTESEIPPAVANANKILVGTQSEMPEQKGKVYKLFFPKLSLPSPYPILTEKSRINSDHRAKKFTHPDKQISLINKHKLNGVKYNVGFIEKRKAAAKPAKKKFDFDF